MKLELDVWYELWDHAGSQGLDTWYNLGDAGSGSMDEAESPDPGASSEPPVGHRRMQ